jgi:hypothetical protein
MKFEIFEAHNAAHHNWANGRKIAKYNPAASTKCAGIYTPSAHCTFAYSALAGSGFGQRAKPRTQCRGDSRRHSPEYHPDAVTRSSQQLSRAQQD